MRRSVFIVLGVTLLMIGTVLPVAAGEQSGRAYTVTDLGTLGGSSGSASGINNHGQIVGQSRTQDRRNLGYLYENGEMTVLYPPTGSNRWSPAVAVNERGQVVGVATTAFMWHDGVWTDLTPDWYSAAQDINDSGQIVGYWGSPGGFRAFAWENGQAFDLIDFGLGGESWASGINNQGQIVGYAYTAAGTRAALWEKGEIIDLGTLGGSYSNAAAISANGWIAGRGATASGDTHAFLWRNGEMTDLGTLGGTSSRAYGVNVLGQVVGDSSTASGDTHAFVWDNGVMTDLGTLGGTYSRAASINDRGVIVGSAWTGTGTESHAVMWTVTN